MNPNAKSSIEDLGEEAADCIETCGLRGDELRLYLTAWAGDVVRDAAGIDASAHERARQAYDETLAGKPVTFLAQRRTEMQRLRAVAAAAKAVDNAIFNRERDDCPLCSMNPSDEGHLEHEEHCVFGELAAALKAAGGNHG
jgi:hypothetical protein